MTNKDISVFRNYQGAYVLSTMHNGYYVHKTYYGYTLAEAKRLFKEEFK